MVELFAHAKKNYIDYTQKSILRYLKTKKQNFKTWQ